MSRSSVVNVDFDTLEDADRARGGLEERRITTTVTLTDTGPVMMISARDWRAARRALHDLGFR